jgi:hypothetical protein
MMSGACPKHRYWSMVCSLRTPAGAAKNSGYRQSERPVKTGPILGVMMTDHLTRQSRVLSAISFQRSASETKTRDLRQLDDPATRRKTALGLHPSERPKIFCHERAEFNDIGFNRGCNQKWDSIV